MGKVDEAKAAGIDIGQYFVAMQTISETKSDVDPKTGKSTTKDRFGLTTRKTKVLDYINDMGLTKEQKDVIMSANGYKVD